MMDLDFLKQFVKQANTESQKTKQYPKKFLDFFIKVSFGQGSLANIPWVAFRKTESSGPYYPVYLFYKEEGKLILSYGIREEGEKPKYTWDKNIHETKTRISHFIEKPKRYGNSYVHKYYEPKIENDEVLFYRDNEKLSEDKLLQELIEILEYFNTCYKNEPESEQSVVPEEDRFASNEFESYKLQNIIEEGSFLDFEKLSLIMRRLKEKKNLILQGPPGTGKTWLAKRLGMALIEKQMKESQISSVQFHPNLSYEDFVRGWRPGSNEKLMLQEGIFMEMVDRALINPDEKYVLVIEEINRGNPAQIFGELLTLIEASKRNSKEAIKLCYPNSEGLHLPVYVPSNLYIIGTMNVADRSLALVDMAFRRRFAFINLEPNLNKTWKDYVVNKLHMDSSVANYIQSEIVNLNSQIASDSRLGKDFQVGHSFFTPNESLKTKDSKKWFREVVESEIAPLLQEYWFDSLEEADKAIEKLLANL